jgi:hypothetical protein
MLMITGANRSGCGFMMELAVGIMQLAKTCIVRFGFSGDIIQDFQSYDFAFNPLLQIQ